MCYYDHPPKAGGHVPNILKVLILLLASASLAYAQSLKLSDAEKSVVQVVVQKPDQTIAPTGTGFFVRVDGTIATALHVYNDATRTIAESRGGRLLVRRATRQSGTLTWGEVAVLSVDAAHDLALIRLSKLDKSAWDKVGGIQILGPTASREVDPGVSVKIVGYFGNDMFPVTLSSHLAGASVFTVVTGPGSGNDIEEFLLSAMAAPGQSGSPVLLNGASVLGVVISIVPVSLPLPFSSQPLHSGLIRASKAEHLQRLLSSLPE